MPATNDERALRPARRRPELDSCQKLGWCLRRVTVSAPSARSIAPTRVAARCPPCPSRRSRRSVAIGVDGRRRRCRRGCRAGTSTPFAAVVVGEPLAAERWTDSASPGSIVVLAELSASLRSDDVPALAGIVGCSGARAAPPAPRCRRRPRAPPRWAAGATARAVPRIRVMRAVRFIGAFLSFRPSCAVDYPHDEAGGCRPVSAGCSTATEATFGGGGVPHPWPARGRGRRGQDPARRQEAARRCSRCCSCTRTRSSRPGG